MGWERKIAGLPEIKTLGGGSESQKPAAVGLRGPGIAKADAVECLESGSERVAVGLGGAVETAAPDVIGDERELDVRRLRCGRDEHLRLRCSAIRGGRKGEGGESGEPVGAGWSTREFGYHGSNPYVAGWADGCHRKRRSSAALQNAGAGRERKVAWTLVQTGGDFGLKSKLLSCVTR